MMTVAGSSGMAKTAKRKFLCTVSSVFWTNGVCPGLVGNPVAEEGVGQDQELAGHRDEGDFAGLAPRLQRRVEALHRRAVADGSHRRLVQRAAHLGTPPADVPD